MRNTIVLETINADGVKAPDTGKTVQIYGYHASDAAGGSPHGALIGSASENTGTGVYYADITNGVKVTVVVDGLCRANMIGVWMNGEDWNVDF